MKISVLIIGAGGHAKVLADALRAAGEPVLGFTDKDPTKSGSRLLGFVVLGDDDEITARGSDTIRLANGIGSTRSMTARRNAYVRFHELGYRFATVIHPGAIVAPSAVLAEGVQVLAGAVIQPGAVVGTNTIVNTGAVIDHDSQVGAHCHIAPGCTLSGTVTIGDESHIGVGASVKEGVRLGPKTVVGAGAVVIADHPGDCQLVGVPARDEL